ncbi:FxsA family protein [Pseudaestuariivita rosea]|uniref:FxsA family protein n=1 Tax=Pseudaestuariivita rosea TaxID=2763263 RepID=UPI001ABB531E|nr:FxsA family protein [Pseudaestuariivita rosea]
MRLLLLFIFIPLIEIALFIQIGGLIGLWPTLIIVVLTALLGSWLVKSQGLAVIGRIQRSFSEMKDPSRPLADGAMILFSGALLLTPGFFTDAVGFALFVPSVRTAVFNYVRQRVSIRFQRAGDFDGPRTDQRNDTIEGEFNEVDPDKKPTHLPSDWTRH